VYHNIDYVIATLDHIKKDMLNEFDRYYETHHIYQIENNALKKTDDYFIDDWDIKDKAFIISYMKRTIINGGHVSLAYFNHNIVGFGIIDAQVYPNDTLWMPYLHVDRAFRYQGIGKHLFQMLVTYTRNSGKKRLYLATHPEIHIQQFYDTLGTHITEDIIQSIYLKEPRDIQRVYKIR